VWDEIGFEKKNSNFFNEQESKTYKTQLNWKEINVKKKTKIRKQFSSLKDEDTTSIKFD
jgi:hypothetical protein